MTQSTKELLAMREHVRLMLAQIDHELSARSHRVRDRDLCDYRPHPWNGFRCGV